MNIACFRCAPQIQMLQEQLMLMSARNESGPKSSSKMPLFDLVKDKETFKLWKSRWDIHIQGHKFDSISNSVERNIKLRAELNSCLSDDTLNWLLNNNFAETDLAKAEFVLNAIELKVNESTNPLIQQVEMSRIVQNENETGDHLVQRIRDISGKCAYDKITNVQDHLNMLTLLKAVRPTIRKKMLLQKVDTFEKAITVLLSEEQANSDARMCSEPKDAAVFAMSSYRREQQSDRQSSSISGRKIPKPDYECYRCLKVGKHYPNDCPAIDQKCNRCEYRGHFGKACQQSKKSVPSGRANAIRAYVEKLSPNEAAVFNAGQIEKAEHCGLVYNVENNDVENPEIMTRHQRAGMFGHLN